MPLNVESRFPRQKLGFFPSPLHKLERLSNTLKYNIWAKRDDVSSGLAYGGNKVRKLEWLIPDAIAKGCDTLVSIGGIQSNHTRQVAAVAAVMGMQCKLVQETWAPFEDEVYAEVGNILLSRLMGAEILLEGSGYSTEEKRTWAHAINQVKIEGGTPYPIPAGASDHPLGGLGYANFADELALQEAELGIFFDTLVVATCTGSTQAGMVVGFSAQARRRTVIGIDTAAKPEMTRAAVEKVVKNTATMLGVTVPDPTEAVLIDSRWAGPAYGIPDKETISAIRLSAEMEGMLTDPVYEGKSMAGLIGMAKNREFKENSNILYVHLGGSPAINAYHSTFE